MGKIGNIISQFKDQIHLPVDVNDVLAKIKPIATTADVEFIGVDLDTLVIRGKYRIFDRSVGIYTGDWITMANIYYHKGDSSDWQRFVCCKELTHLLDDVDHHTSDRAGQVELARQVGLPLHLQDPLKAPIEANIDLIAEYFALALLLPIAARDLFMPAFEAKKLTSHEVAIIADIPEYYVAMCLSPLWPSIHDRLLSF